VCIDNSNTYFCYQIPYEKILKADNNMKLQPSYQTCMYYVLEIYLMVAESEPVLEPTNHRCEECGKIFPSAEKLTTHYTKDHPESS
jgi:hypothetical protein